MVNDSGRVLWARARSRFEFGKFNFAGGFYRFRFHTLRISTTIFNALFVFGVLDFIHWCLICSSSPIFFGGKFAISADSAKFYATAIAIQFNLDRIALVIICALSPCLAAYEATLPDAPALAISPGLT